MTVTPTGGTATTFTINPSTKFFQGFTAATAAALANGDLVLVTAAASAPTIATSIDVYVAPSSNGHGGGTTATTGTATREVPSTGAEPLDRLGAVHWTPAQQRVLSSRRPGRSRASALPSTG